MSNNICRMIAGLKCPNYPMWCDKDKVKILEAENAELKAELDTYKSIVDGLPSGEDIEDMLDNMYRRGELPQTLYFQDIQNIAKEIHKLIHKGE